MATPEMSLGRSKSGRRAANGSTGGWSTGQLAHHIGMSSKFVLKEIQAGEIAASRFGSEYRIAAIEVRRYLKAKGYPLPEALAS